MFCCLVPASSVAPGVLTEIARACSPRVEIIGHRVVVFDARGLGRVLGPPDEIVRAVTRLAAGKGVAVRVALAPTATAARLLAHAGATAVKDVDIFSLKCLFPEKESRPLDDALAIFRRWGLRTCGDVARLPRAEVAARLGAWGIALHQAACGDDAGPLVPQDEERRFLERIDLEWPIEGLEPLAFVLARLCDGHALALERADRGAVTVTTRLTLVTRAVHERVLQIPAPMRDAKVLRTLIVLDLESHPPPAGIDAVEIELGVVPGRIAQGSLLTRTLPTPETLTTLIARLGALMGETRVGAPALVDAHDARVIAMKRFAPGTGKQHPGTPPLDSRSGRPEHCRRAEPRHLGTMLRRLRFPLAATVKAEHGAPVAVAPSARGLAGGPVVARAGPWRSSGRWWAGDRAAWDRDDWDVELDHGGRLHLSHDRVNGRWEVGGIFD
jgi:protein ImuB